MNRLVSTAAVLLALALAPAEAAFAQAVTGMVGNQPFIMNQFPGSDVGTVGNQPFIINHPPGLPVPGDEMDGDLPMPPPPPMPTPNYGNMPYAAPDGTPLYNPDGTRAPTPEAAPAPAPNYAPAATMFTANCVYRRKDILVALSAADDSASINVSVDNRWVGDAKGHHRQAIDRNGMGVGHFVYENSTPTIWYVAPSGDPHYRSAVKLNGKWRPLQCTGFQARS